MPELFDALAGAAAARGCRYFGFLNADILVSQAAIDVIAREARDAYAFSRREIDAETGRELSLILNGLDLFVFAAEWWRRERHRFRPYILAEWFYDCVIWRAVGVPRRRADSQSRRRNPSRGASSRAFRPLAQYNGYLAALDAPYFSLWVGYRQRLDELRQRGASEADERALQREIFVWRPSWPSMLVQVGRQLKAGWRYRRLHREMVRDC